MAHTIRSYDWRQAMRSQQVYPWDEWLNGQIWWLDEGEDFTHSLDYMRKKVYEAAERRRLKVRTSVHRAAKALVLQAVSQED